MTKNKTKPTCYIIAGPNGAGKTTFAMGYLPKIVNCRNFINADLIAYGISPLNSIAVQFEAGRLFLNEIYKYIQKKDDFAFETTLSGRSHLSLLNKLKAEGWTIVMFFLWIPSPQFSRDRVRQRVHEGGHDIPDDTIFRRYPKIMYNLIHLYMPLCHKIFCYDNSSLTPVSIFEQTPSGINIINEEFYHTILRCANEFKKNK
ncbi:MAG: zeta toxin family protein [Bacteroidales bacterium]|nr:zeta toxin family protein [Bacteroidales bacterium]